MAKNVLAPQTTVFQNSKADNVFLAFPHCILPWTPPCSSGGDVSTSQRAECLLRSCRCDDFPFCDSNFQMLFPLLRTEYAAAYGIPWYQVFIWLPWVLQWHWHVFAIQRLLIRTASMPERILCLESVAGLLLMCWLLCCFSLCRVFSSCLYLLGWFLSLI